MAELHISEHDALFKIHYARGLQYLHVVAWRNGATCIRPGDTDREFSQAMAAQDRIAALHQNLMSNDEWL